MLANKMKMDSANHKQTDDVDVLKKKQSLYKHVKEL